MILLEPLLKDLEQWTYRGPFQSQPLTPLANSCTFAFHDCIKQNKKSNTIYVNKAIKFKLDCGTTEYYFVKDNIDGDNIEHRTTKFQLARHNSYMDGNVGR